MKRTNKIFLSSLMTFALLALSGCGGSSSDSSTENQTVVPEETTPPEIEVIPVDTAPVKPIYKPAGWYGKTQVSATLNGETYNHNTAGIFGELLQSEDTEDQHDIKGYGSAVLQVIMIPDFSSDTTIGYFSEYKKYNEDSAEKKVWTFQIKNQHTTNLSNAPIEISMDGIYDVSYTENEEKVNYKISNEINSAKSALLHLVDLDNQTHYTLTELASANLNMDGLHTRNFRWVLGEVDNSDYEKSMEVTTKSAAFTQSKSAVFETEEEIQSSSKFGLPPR